MSKQPVGLFPENFDQRFDRAFGLVAFIVNRHIVDHMRRIIGELDMDPETALIWGTLAHLNAIPHLPQGSDPMALLDELGRRREKKMTPVRLTDVVQVTGLRRETVRRKLERLRENGKVERTADARWQYVSAGVGEDEREFVRRTVVQFLRTAECLLKVLAQVDPGKPDSGQAGMV